MLREVTFPSAEVEIIWNVFSIFRDPIRKDTGSDIEKVLRRIERASRPIKISSRKQKGRNLQKWVCERISSLLRIPYSQDDDNCLIHSREMGQSGVDVILRGEAFANFPFRIECKSSEKLSLSNTIYQAKKNAGDDWWMIVYKRKNFKNPIVIMDWMDFEGFYKFMVEWMSGELGGI